MASTLIRQIPISISQFVKLLVNHGADIQAVWADTNATTLADRLGRFEIRDYLVAQGGVDLRDVTPPDYPRSHELIDERFKQRFRGGSKLVLELDELEPRVVIMLVDGEKGQTLYTNELSDRSLPFSPSKHPCTELIVSLPPDTDQESTLFEWVIGELSRMVEMLRAQQDWFPQQIMPAQPPDTDYPFTGWLVLRLDFGVTPPDTDSLAHMN